ARPPDALFALSPINSTPAWANASTTLIRLSITPRTVPLLASILWIVGSDTPDRSANICWSRPRSARAARICEEVIIENNVATMHIALQALISDLPGVNLSATGAEPDRPQGGWGRRCLCRMLGESGEGPRRACRMLSSDLTAVHGRGRRQT